ncbi:MAG: hypothetical protein K5787_20555 [Lentisphaeria bacterium]|nr:hypothetical protein [Victivallales bacterium]MCR4576155.1 hypothetical protein [Lentisphaeria bacterium]
MADNERELGEQPIEQLMQELGLENNDLVVASTEQLTHKMVSKARKGRFLTMNVRLKVLHALCKASGNEYKLDDLFNYR